VGEGEGGLHSCTAGIKGIAGMMTPDTRKKT
jgi:hypothetical protein